ncbi:hypothetical protein [Candidatus Vampirococcus lugosii]|uniref:Uncharacterized protein n=1 Tax=Candidatus Vampirococcus lugosii TaxID=2789015 RepID=A0ABS5QMM6_9BACT|nr:hypothetical protein [Candidatus Vampirococcus lugosii]MBS8122465.1 hypothetical protein [Candidatus Vampirococcus lugosii]
MTRKQYIVGFILLIGAIFGILAYYFSLDGRFSDIKDNIKDIINNISFNKNEKSDNSINLKADVNFDLNSSIDNFEISFSGSDLGILSMDNGLKQRLSANNLSFILKDGFGEEKVEISNLDLISNEESVYYKFGESEFLEEIFGNTNNNDDYTKIDNSKFIIQMIGDLANNDLIVGLIKGLVSSNPNAYFEKYGIDEELLNLFFSKGSYKLLFE